MWNKLNIRIFYRQYLGADLYYMQLVSKYNKGLKFLFGVNVIFDKNAWVVPLPDKKGVIITSDFQTKLYKYNSKSDKIWVDKGS